MVLDLLPLLLKCYKALTNNIPATDICHEKVAGLMNMMVEFSNQSNRLDIEHGSKHFMLYMSNCSFAELKMKMY